MFVHSVYFWLNPGLADEEVNEFWRGVNSLATIETVRQSYIGIPAPTDRPIIDRSYSCALILAFDDQAGHDVYQDHQIHEAFRQKCSRFWSKVVIYDVVP
ncbi:MAG TPA: Dabb family protein [Blastocatellia bacterium]|nr:Dabb family protein [Blastocatellia bacterium]